MSNRRRSAWGNSYRTGYLRSPAWFARRDRWFSETRALRIPLLCAACARPATPNELELHHLDYRGVIRTERGWLSRERYDDLVALHPLCHDLLHRLIERDRVLGGMRGRRDASRIALSRLRQKLTTTGAP